MVLPSAPQPGVDSTPQPGGEVTPEPDQVTTVSPQEPVSDTVVTPTPPEEPSRPVEPPSVQEVLNLQAQLSEQKNIQSGLDKTVTRLTDERDKATDKVKELETTLSSYQSATAGNEDSITALTTEVETQRQQLQKYEADLKATLDEHERLKIVVGEFMGDNPVSQLIKNDALPRAADHDEFRMKMSGVVGSIANAAEQSAFIRLGPERPPAAPPSGGPMPTLTDLNAKLNAALAAGDSEEYARLTEQRYDLLNAQGLPGEKNTQRF